MKKIGAGLCAWIVAACCSMAQISVEVTLDQDQFLPGESLPATVRIVNRSGQTLNLGTDPGWLRFNVESKDGYIVIKKAEVVVQEAFTLDSSKRATTRVDLAPYFSLSKPGHYAIVATVSIKDWNQHISSAAKGFDIIEGSKLWEQVVGLPKTPGATNQAPELRRYTLHEANYLRKHLMLYVQVSGLTGKIFKVYPLGPMLSFGQPEPQVDKLSNLHVLYQDGPHSFSYFVIDPDGTLTVRQKFDYTTRPRLKADGDGNFRVEGGVRRLTADDLPPSKPQAEAASPESP